MRLRKTLGLWRWRWKLLKGGFRPGHGCPVLRLVVGKMAELAITLREACCWTPSKISRKSLRGGVPPGKVGGGIGPTHGRQEFSSPAETTSSHSRWGTVCPEGTPPPSRSPTEWEQPMTGWKYGKLLRLTGCLDRPNLPRDSRERTSGTSERSCRRRPLGRDL